MKIPNFPNFRFKMPFQNWKFKFMKFKSGIDFYKRIFNFVQLFLESILAFFDIFKKEWLNDSHDSESSSILIRSPCNFLVSLVNFPTWIFFRRILEFYPKICQLSKNQFFAVKFFKEFRCFRIGGWEPKISRKWINRQVIILFFAWFVFLH